MRRILLLAMIFGLAACSTPAIRLSPSYVVGAERVYRLVAKATTSIDVGGSANEQRTELRARSTMRVLSVEGDEAVLRVTLAPERFTVDGKASDPPAEQTADLAVGLDGAVRRVLTVGGVKADLLAPDIEDLAPVIGSPLPVGRMHLGDRWTRRIDPPQVESNQGPPIGPGQQRGRLAALRVVRGVDCAIVSLSTTRPLVRERAQGDQPVRLVGTEVSATELAFAFREGYPVEIRTTAEGRFDVGSGPTTGGSVTILNETTMTLVSSTKA